MKCAGIVSSSVNSTTKSIFTLTRLLRGGSAMCFLSERRGSLKRHSHSLRDRSGERHVVCVRHEARQTHPASVVETRRVDELRLLRQREVELVFALQKARRGWAAEDV